VKVVVIGGGVIGYSVATALAGRGADVTVIEMRGPGAGATQASAGMLAPYIEGHDEVLRRLGVQSLALYDDYIDQLQSMSPVEYARCGTLQVAQSSQRLGELERDAERLAGQSAAHSLLTAEQVRHIEPQLATDIVGGLHVLGHGYVHVPQLMSALTESAARRGVTTRTDRVLGIEQLPGGLGAVTARGTVAASTIVVAAGSWSGQIVLPGSPQIPVRPIKGQSIEVSFPVPPLRHIVWSEHCYLVPWQSGSMIVGATVEDVGFDESTTDEAADWLLGAARAVLPLTERAGVRTARAGLRPATRDQLPLIGWSSTMRGVCLAAGHYRNGVLLAPLTATMVAEIVCGEDPPETRWARQALDPARMGL
jgi:glycine oxidase